MLPGVESDLIRILALACIILAGLVVSITSWLPRGKRLADWVMVVGATMAPLGLLLMTLYYEVLYSMDSLYDIYDWLEDVSVGLTAGGAILFAMGFAMDRISRRKREEFRAATGQAFPPQP